MQRLIYDLGLGAMQLGFRLASPFNEKAAQWIDGRKDWRKKLKKLADDLPKDKKRVWVHVSSLGEFEQGRPLMDALIERGHSLTVSFFSPSGYEQRKDWPGADAIVYLPLDTAKNARDFITILKPDIGVFVKYELWFHYLNELKKQKVPSIMVSGRFYKEQDYFSKWYTWGRKHPHLFSRIEVQDEVSKELLESIGYDQAEVSGDIRYDRVTKLARNQDPFEKIEAFCEGSEIFMAGSSWPSDEKVFLPYLLGESCPYKAIIAPHDISDSHVDEIMKQSGEKAIRWSDFDKYNGEKILIIDCIGMLSRIYKFADIAFIGGAFKEGLHNILEPAAYGVGVIAGPKHKGFPEALEMEKAGAMIRIHSKEEFEAKMEEMEDDPSIRENLSANARNFIQSRTGATARSLEVIEELLS